MYRQLSYKYELCYNLMWTTWIPDSVFVLLPEMTVHMTYWRFCVMCAILHRVQYTTVVHSLATWSLKATEARARHRHTPSATNNIMTWKLIKAVNSFILSLQICNHHHHAPALSQSPLPLSGLIQLLVLNYTNKFAAHFRKLQELPIYKTSVVTILSLSSLQIY